MRIFIAVLLPENVKNLLGDYIKESVIGGAVVPRDNFHITLKFIGEADSKAINEIIKGLKSIKFKEFKCSLEGIGFFGRSESPFVLFSKVKKGFKEVVRLSNIVHEKTAKYAKDFEFHPHVTLARKPKFSSLNSFKSEEFSVEGFSLMKSVFTDKGVKYDVIESFNLIQ